MIEAVPKNVGGRLFVDVKVRLWKWSKTITRLDLGFVSTPFPTKIPEYTGWFFEQADPDNYDSGVVFDLMQHDGWKVLDGYWKKQLAAAMLQCTKCDASQIDYARGYFAGLLTATWEPYRVSAQAGEFEPEAKDPENQSDMYERQRKMDQMQTNEFY